MKFFAKVANLHDDGAVSVAWRVDFSAHSVVLINMVTIWYKYINYIELNVIDILTPGKRHDSFLLGRRETRKAMSRKNFFARCSRLGLGRCGTTSQLLGSSKDSRVLKLAAIMMAVVQVCSGYSIVEALKDDALGQCWLTVGWQNVLDAFHLQPATTQGMVKKCLARSRCHNYFLGDLVLGMVHKGETSVLLARLWISVLSWKHAKPRSELCWRKEEGKVRSRGNSKKVPQASRAI